MVAAIAKSIKFDWLGYQSCVKSFPMKFSRKHLENPIAFRSPSNFSNSADSLRLASRGILRSGFLCTAWRAAKRKDRFQRMLLPLVLRAVAPSPPYSSASSTSFSPPLPSILAILSFSSSSSSSFASASPFSLHAPTSTNSSSLPPSALLLWPILVLIIYF